MNPSVLSKAFRSAAQLRSRFVGMLGVVTVLCAAIDTAALGGPKSHLLSQFPPGQSTCYGRSYDTAYLSAHPNQELRDLFVFHTLIDDAQSELFQRTPEEEAKLDREQAAQRVEIDKEQGVKSDMRGEVDVLVAARFRAADIWYKAPAWCRPRSDGGLDCELNCDGGSFQIHGGEESLLLAIGNANLHLNATCFEGQDPPSGMWKHRRDDQKYSLERAEISKCLWARDAARPDFAASAVPLRQRIAQGTRCFLGAELQGLSGIKSASLQITQIDWGGQARDADPSFDGVLRVRSTSGGVAAAPVHCQSDEFGFDCEAQNNGNGVNKGFRLRRHSIDGVLLTDRLPDRHEPTIAALVGADPKGARGEASAILIEQNPRNQCDP